MQNRGVDPREATCAVASRAQVEHDSAVDGRSGGQQSHESTTLMTQGKGAHAAAVGNGVAGGAAIEPMSGDMS